MDKAKPNPDLVVVNKQNRKLSDFGFIFNQLSLKLIKVIWDTQFYNDETEFR